MYRTTLYLLPRVNDDQATRPQLMIPCESAASKFDNEREFWEHVSTCHPLLADLWHGDVLLFQPSAHLGTPPSSRARPRLRFLRLDLAWRLPIGFRPVLNPGYSM